MTNQSPQPQPEVLAVLKQAREALKCARNRFNELDDMKGAVPVNNAIAEIDSLLSSLPAEIQDAGHLASAFRQPVQGAGPVWRCFHCDEAFTDREAAALHFGTSEFQQAICTIDPTHFRWMEAQHRRNVEDDSEALRSMRHWAGEHEDLRRQAEEQGYARGLADAKKYPAELGLTAIDPAASAQCPNETESASLPPQAPMAEVGELVIYEDGRFDILVPTFPAVKQTFLPGRYPLYTAPPKALQPAQGLREAVRELEAIHIIATKRDTPLGIGIGRTAAAEIARCLIASSAEAGLQALRAALASPPEPTGGVDPSSRDGKPSTGVALVPMTEGERLTCFYNLQNRHPNTRMVDYLRGIEDCEAHHGIGRAQA